jgi:Zn-dependent metalloprotease
MKRIQSSFVILVLLGIFVLSAISIAYAYYQNAPIGADKAEENVKSFTGIADISFQNVNITNLPQGEVYELKSKVGVFYVNSHSGDIERATFVNNVQNSTQVIISIADAEKLAESFSSHNYKNFTQMKNMQLTGAELLDHGTYKAYVFTWNEIINGTKTPNWVQVTINPETGNIISYIGLNRPVLVNMEPKIQKSDAVNIAINQFKNILTERTDAQLCVIYTKDNIQKLTWVVNVEGAPQDNICQGGMVVVDAMNGDVLIVGPYD